MNADRNDPLRPERRVHLDLRARFDAVVLRVEPFFREGGGLNGSRTDFWVVRSIRDAYPDLDNEQAHVLANAAMRYFRERAG